MHGNSWNGPEEHSPSISPSLSVYRSSVLITIQTKRDEEWIIYRRKWTIHNPWGGTRGRGRGREERSPSTGRWSTIVFVRRSAVNLFRRKFARRCDEIFSFRNVWPPWRRPGTPSTSSAPSAASNSARRASTSGMANRTAARTTSTCLRLNAAAAIALSWRTIYQR